VTSASAALRSLWIAVAVQLAGRLLDLRWHVSHDEFEGTSEQIEAHWLVWLGVLATVTVAAWVVLRRERLAGYPGYVLTAVSGLLYIPVAVWHFIEHANGADPGVAHVLLAVGQIGMVVGAFVATVAAGRDRRAAAGEPGAATQPAPKGRLRRPAAPR
jgi:hypothetical protein